MQTQTDGPHTELLPLFFNIRRFTFHVQLLLRTKYFILSRFTLPQTRTRTTRSRLASTRSASRSRPPSRSPLPLAVAVRPRSLSLSGYPPPRRLPHRSLPPLFSPTTPCVRHKFVGQRLHFFAGDELLGDGGHAVRALVLDLRALVLDLATEVLDVE